MKNKIKHLKTTILMKSSTWKCMNFISNVTYNNKTTKYKNKMKERLRKLCNERERERERVTSSVFMMMITTSSCQFSAPK